MTCACGKELDRVPAWMSNVNIQFICQNCPSRDVQSIADVKLPSTEGSEEPVKKKKQATK